MKNVNEIESENTNVIVPNNSLVIYKGGGYDGCFWEYNAYLVKDEKYIDLFSSGYAGVKEPNENSINEVDSPEIIDLTNQEEVLNFTNTNSIGLCLVLGTKINKIYEKDVLFCKCSICGEIIPCDDFAAFGDGSVCQGGLVYDFTNFICNECYQLGTCYECGEYVGAENLTDGICKFCSENDEDEE